MKTAKDLYDLIPEISEMLRKTDHNIGCSIVDEDEDGRSVSHEWEDNYFEYEEDGWEMYFYYSLHIDTDPEDQEYETGPLEICMEECYVSHYDEDGEQSTFTEEEEQIFLDAIEKAILNIS